MVASPFVREILQLFQHTTKQQRLCPNHPTQKWKYDRINQCPSEHWTYAESLRYLPRGSWFKLGISTTSLRSHILGPSVHLVLNKYFHYMQRNRIISSIYFHIAIIHPKRRYCLNIFISSTKQESSSVSSLHRKICWRTEKCHLPVKT